MVENRKRRPAADWRIDGGPPAGRATSPEIAGNLLTRDRECAMPPAMARERCHAWYVYALGEMVLDATEVAVGATVLRAATAGTATREPTAPMVRMTGAMMVRRMRMIPPCVKRGQQPATRSGGPHDAAGLGRVDHHQYWADYRR